MTEITRVTIDYTNWKGKRGKRVIDPISIWFGKTLWHTENQWLLHAVDVASGKRKDFAMKDIHKWERAE